MLYAFHLQRNEHQDERIATESPLLPEDDVAAIDLALSRKSSAMLLAIKARSGNLEGNLRGKTALMRAVAKDDVAAIELLLAAGADINATDRTGKSVLQMALHDNRLRSLQILVFSVNLDNQTKKRTLAQALKENNVKAFIILAKSFADPDSDVKDLISQYLLIAINKGDLNALDGLLSIPGADVARNVKKHPCLHWALKKGNLAVIKKILEKSQHLFQIPLLDIIKDFSHFDSVEKCKNFYSASDPISYLDSHQLCEAVTIYALRILQADKAALAHDAKKSRHKESESAMDSKAVLRANKHYNQKVKPHFAEKFALLGLPEIEKAIRKLILQTIKDEAQIPLNQTLINFIETNQEALVNGDQRALEESVKHMTLITPSHAAWRGYNPFASVKGNWINLLTRPEENIKVYSTEEAVAGDIKSVEASNIVRERVAYYYLAVTDETDGDDNIRNDRKGNFIGLLSEIRNAHGLDDPSCFPGYLTRIAQMGNYHAIAQQPAEFKSDLVAFFTSKVFESFKAKREELPCEAQQQLLRALVDLNHLTAKDIICRPGRYSEQLLNLRKNFTDLLGNEISLFESFKQTTTFPLDVDDLVYFKQHLLDLTRGDIANCLEQYVRLKSDRHTTQDDLEKLNPFGEEDKKAQALFADLLKHVQQTVPRYRHSIHQLQGFAEFAVFRVKQLIVNSENSDQYLKELIEVMELNENKQVVLQTFEQILAAHSIFKNEKTVTNPFVQQLKQMEQSIKQTPHPKMVEQLQKRLPNLQRKVDLFKLFIDYLSQETVVPQEQAVLIEMTKLAVEYTVQNDAFEPTAFKQCLLEESDLPVVEEELDSIINELNNFFPENYRSKSIPLIRL